VEGLILAERANSHVFRGERSGHLGLHISEEKAGGFPWTKSQIQTKEKIEKQSSEFTVMMRAVGQAK